MTRDEFRYIVVGGGSAGCVLANRLSADPESRVLLLEAGGRDFNPLISVPIGMGKLYQHKLHDWLDVSEPEPEMGDRPMEVTRGRVLGGSSSINVMAYTRGHPLDYDGWAEAGASGWSFVDVLPFFKSSETWEGGEDRWRGGGGPLGTQWARTTDPIYSAWVEAGRRLGHPATSDYNGADPDGFGRGQYTIRDGRRSSTSRAFLRPVRTRRNLVIVTGALATRILFQGTRAIGVEYAKGGALRRARAEGEVIVSAGAISSPQLLLLSGIGPADHLKRIGVAPLLDLPVGRNLQDHVGVSLNWRRAGPPGPFHRLMRFDRAALAMASAYLFGRGPATVVPGGLHAFLRSAPGVSRADIEILFYTAPAETRLWFPFLAPPYQDGYGITPVLLRPQSRGFVELKSSDPRERPRIVYQALSEPADMAVLRDGVKRARELGDSEALAPFRGGPVGAAPVARTDREIDAVIRQEAITKLHPVGTCPMGRGEDAVLDPNLKVRGADALRVVDGSVMPTIVSAHPNAAIVMIAERAAGLILARTEHRARTPPVDRREAVR